MNFKKSFIMILLNYYINYYQMTIFPIEFSIIIIIKQIVEYYS